MTRQASSKTCRRSAGRSMTMRTVKVMRRGAAPAGVARGRRCSRTAAPATASAVGSGRRGAFARGLRRNRDRVDAAAFHEVDGASVARPLRLVQPSEEPSAAPSAAAAFRRDGGIEPLQMGAVVGDGVQAGTAARGLAASAGRAAHGHKGVGLAVGSRNHQGDGAGHAGELLETAVHAVPVDFDRDILGSPAGHRRAASSAAAAAFFVERRHGLRLGVDLTIVGRLLEAGQRNRIELAGGAAETLRGHRRNAHPAHEHQFPAVRRPACSLGDLEQVGGDHALLAVRQFLHIDMRAQQAVRLGIGDPLAVGRELGARDIAGIGRRHDLALAALDIHAPQLVIGAAPQQRLRIRRPHQA